MTTLGTHSGCQVSVLTCKLELNLCFLHILSQIEIKIRIHQCCQISSGSASYCCYRGSEWGSAAVYSSHHKSMYLGKIFCNRCGGIFLGPDGTESSQHLQDFSRQHRWISVCERKSIIQTIAHNMASKGVPPVLPHESVQDWRQKTVSPHWTRWYSSKTAVYKQQSTFSIYFGND